MYFPNTMSIVLKLVPKITPCLKIKQIEVIFQSCVRYRKTEALVETSLWSGSTTQNMVVALASGTEAVKEMKTGSNLKMSANRPALNLQAEVTNILF